MRAPLTAMAALAAMAVFGAGCGDPARGHLQVNWTFAGNSCLAAGVHTIQVDIAHELLTPNQFSCDLGSSGIAGGADLGTYLVGQYTLTISGLDTDGTVLYQTQQVVTVQRGDNVLQIDVPKVAGGSISVNWRFGSVGCVQAGVTSVRMSLDGALILDQGGSVDIPCRSNGADGTSISPVAPGSHRLDLVGMKGGVPSYWLPAVQVSVTDGVDAQVNVNLPVGQPASATADVSWDALLSGGGFALGAQGAMTCSEAQVDVVRIALDPNTDGSGGTLLGDFACDTAGAEGTQLSVPAGNHSFAISGIRGSTVVYQTMHPAPAARFELGLVSNVDVDADPVGNGLGISTTLSWDFSLSGPACPVSYTLTDPSGAKQTGSTPCGTNGIQLPGAKSGLWSIDATAGTFQAQILFGVPNQASASWNIPFSR